VVRRARATLCVLLPLLVVAALPSAPARAEVRYRVVLLRPTITDDVTTDALARVRGELTAAGFEVSTLARDPAGDVRTALETSGRELEPIATFAIVPGGATAEIWVCDRIAGKSVIQNVRLDGPVAAGEHSRSAVLAVQAVELLKASLAQYWLMAAAAAAARRSQAPPAPGPPEVAVPPAPEAATYATAGYATAGVGLQAGVGWLDSAGAVGPVWQPIVRASYGGVRGWAARLTLGGLGSDASLSAGSVGSASIGQQLAALEVVRGFRAGRRVQLVATLGAGGYRARIAGTGVAPYVGRDSDEWSLLTVGGGGVIVTIARHLALTAEAQAMLTWPHTTVRLGGSEAGRTGWPSLLLSAGALATF